MSFLEKEPLLYHTSSNGSNEKTHNNFLSHLYSVGCNGKCFANIII